MAINYVKFLRGSQKAYDNLKQSKALDKNTLYFIYPNQNASTGALYLGEKIISSGDTIFTNSNLSDLNDVDLSEVKAGDILIRTPEGTWKAMTPEKLQNYISSVTEDFSVNKSGQLSLNNLAQSKIIGLEDILNTKIDSSWINLHANDTVGLSQNNFTNELLNKLNSLQPGDGSNADYITSVDSSELKVSQDGQLSISSINISKVSGITELLNDKANQSDIEEINNRLTWQEIPTK